MIRAALACLVLAGCAGANPERQHFLTTEWGDCIASAVKRMDDGKTDPVSLAYGISPMCAVQYNALTEAEAAGLITQEGQDNMRRLMRDNEVKSITSAIIIHRSKKPL